MSHLNPSMQSPAAPVNPSSPRPLQPSAVHNDNEWESVGNLHQHIRHGIAEGRATPLLVGAYFTAMVFVVCLVLYGLNHQSSESGQETTASAPATSTPARAPQTQQPQNQTQQPQNAAPQPAQLRQQQQPVNAQPPQGQNQPQGQQGSQAPAPQNSAPNGQQNAPAPNAQQSAPAPKQ